VINILNPPDKNGVKVFRNILAGWVEGSVITLPGGAIAIHDRFRIVTDVDGFIYHHPIMAKTAG
jgi:hypothetical protein